MPLTLKALASLMGLALILLLGGCAGIPGSAGAEQSFTLMTTARTAFFANGPGELAPETYLEAGTRVRVMSSTGTMAHVQTVDGRTGWVAAGDVGAAQDPESH
jgi:hypothetical protein